MIDHGVVAAAAEPRELLRRGPAEPARTDLKPISITQPEGPSFTVDGNLVAVAEVAVPRRRSIRTRGWCCTRSRTTTTGARRSILHRASISEMVVPYGDPERAARVEERVRRGRVGPRPHDAAAHARLRLPRRDPLLRRHARQRAGRAVGRSRTRSACTRRTTGSSGSTSTCAAGAARCAAAGASSSASSRPSATTSTASSGTSTSTATSSSR